MAGKRRYYIDTDVAITAWLGGSGARAWLRKHGKQSYYSKVMLLDLRNLVLRCKLDPSDVPSIIATLHAYGVAKLWVSIPSLYQRASSIAPQGMLFDAMHALAAAQNNLHLVTYNVSDYSKLQGKIPNLVVKRCWGTPVALPGKKCPSPTPRGSKRG